MWTRSEHFTSLSASFVLLGLEYIGKPFQGAEDFFGNVSVGHSGSHLRGGHSSSFPTASCHHALRDLFQLLAGSMDGWLATLGLHEAEWNDGFLSPTWEGHSLTRGSCAQVLCGVCPSCLETATIRGITRTSLQAQCVGLPGFTGFRHI